MKARFACTQCVKEQKESKEYKTVLEQLFCILKSPSFNWLDKMIREMHKISKIHGFQNNC